MVIENIKLFFSLFTRPLSAMSDIIDRGNWLFGVLIVSATAFLFAMTVTNQIYERYEAVPTLPQNLRLPQARPVVFQNQPPSNQEDFDEEIYQPRPRSLPLPIVGQKGWWFVSFRPMSQLVIALSLAVLYVPALIFILVMLERTSSFGITIRSDCNFARVPIFSSN